MALVSADTLPEPFGLRCQLLQLLPRRLVAPRKIRSHRRPLWSWSRGTSRSMAKPQPCTNLVLLLRARMRLVIRALHLPRRQLRIALRRNGTHSFDAPG
jgi:hypothetical protein